MTLIIIIDIIHSTSDQIRLRIMETRRIMISSFAIDLPMIIYFSSISSFSIKLTIYDYQLVRFSSFSRHFLVISYVVSCPNCQLHKKKQYNNIVICYRLPNDFLFSFNPLVHVVAFSQQTVFELSLKPNYRL